MPPEHPHEPPIIRVLTLVLLIVGAAISAGPAPLGIPPICVPDELTTSEDEQLDYSVVANDTDAEDYGVYAAVPEDKLSALGARGIIYEHGMLRYDPGWSDVLQALNVSIGATDTFTCTAQDNDGLTAQGVVTITVQGANDAHGGTGHSDLQLVAVSRYWLPLVPRWRVSASRLVPRGTRPTSSCAGRGRGYNVPSGNGTDDVSEGAMQPAKILLIDDEPPILEVLTAYLEGEGYRVLSARDGITGLQMAQNDAPDVLVLDIMLPGMDGIEVLARLRRESNVYVILLTAKTEEADKLVGLSIGADDYVTKPFSPREVVARVKAALRRLRPEPQIPTDELTFGRLRIEPEAHRVWVGEAEVELTPIEFALLQALAEHRGRVLTRAQLIERVWGYDYYGEERVVDVHMGKLRQKLELPGLIATVRGVGYRFEGEAP